ncbi:FAD-dependent oxidoreductase [Microbacterium oryzae]|uniref:NAD(P)/FAD-dependent oxidoreductase n=1 Tax=Microbacterium oryzae TaxID=743009 RepID=UPI0025B22414|nr:FAD-dependent oxidoreductase [Microbacterium oryzae]MDN3310993.1 FAD-dependent oxidoreductase [Microbacterium oryzae]
MIRAAKPADLVIIGAGIMGAATACFAAAAGLSVVVVERGSIASGTSSRCEGNLLVSDKELGPELELARYAQNVWREDLAEHAAAWEFESKGGIIVAENDASATALTAVAEHQRGLGIEVELLPDIADVRRLEPYINPALAGGAFYPEDAQVQPVLATHHLLKLARENGARVLTRTPVLAIETAGGRVSGVRTPDGVIGAGAVINCAGAWASDVAALADLDLPVLPRRGFVLVTEPVPVTIHHKVYSAGYVGDVASSDAGLQVSPVVEGTPSGTILLGASRERVGFDERFSMDAVSRIARAGIGLFPALADLRLLRTYSGFRPYCPDHLPVIGPDARLPGLWHSAGQEGAGIGLSVGIAKLLTQALRGEETDLDLAPFRPERFEGKLAA